MDQRNWIFWVFVGDRDWSEREGMKQLKVSPCVSLGFSEIWSHLLITK